MAQRSLILTVAILAGLTAGIAGYTFVYARGYSYLTNNPAACANCHVMQDHYDGWVKSSHRAVAACNDCHTPHNLVAKYVTKASNGFWHSFAFTSGRFPEPLRIKSRNLSVTESACRSCHEEIVMAIDRHSDPTRQISCVNCHRDAGHMH